MDTIGISWRALRDWFERFFFSPTDCLPAALLRIGFATLVLVQNIAEAPKLFLWFGEHGVISLAGSRAITSPFALTLFSVLPTGDNTLVALFLLYNLTAVALLVGFRSRWMMATVYVLLVSFDHRNRLILDGEDGLLRTLGFLLLFMPCGKALSIDAFLARLRNGTGDSRRPTMEAWPIRLVQIQMALMFISAALWKFKGGNWINGDTVYYVSRLDGFFGRMPIPRFLFEWMPLVRLYTWGTLVVEIGTPFTLMIRELRRPTLVVLFLFHLSLDLSMNLLVFHYVMLLGWSSFLTLQDWRGLRRLGRRVLFALGIEPIGLSLPQTAAWQRLGGALRAVDLFGLLGTADSRAQLSPPPPRENTLRVVLEGTGIVAGARAWSAVLLRVPFLWGAFAFIPFRASRQAWEKWLVPAGDNPAEIAGPSRAPRQKKPRSSR